MVGRLIHIAGHYTGEEVFHHMNKSSDTTSGSDSTTAAEEKEANLEDAMEEWTKRYPLDYLIRIFSTYDRKGQLFGATMTESIPGSWSAYFDSGTGDIVCNSLSDSDGWIQAGKWAGNVLDHYPVQWHITESTASTTGSTSVTIEECILIMRIRENARCLTLKNQ